MWGSLLFSYLHLPCLSGSSTLKTPAIRQQEGCVTLWLPVSAAAVMADLNREAGSATPTSGFTEFARKDSDTCVSW